VRLLLAAAARLARQTDLPDWRLQIVGPVNVAAGGGGEHWQKALDAEFASRLGSRLEWRGPEFDPAKLARVYGGIDIFCYPSLALKGETFGLAVAEAMAAGCAAVVSGLPCFSELVRPGETGLVFDESGFEPEARLASALERLLRDAELRSDLSSRAQAFVRRYDFGEVARVALDDLQTLVGAGNLQSRASSSRKGSQSPP
jgi:glycosyltransferase involved in cell wall biosynthesis